MASFTNTDRPDASSVIFRRLPGGVEVTVVIDTERAPIAVTLTSAQLSAALTAAGRTPAQARALMVALYDAAVTAAGGV